MYVYGHVRFLAALPYNRMNGAFFSELEYYIISLTHEEPTINNGIGNFNLNVISQ